MKFFKYVLLVLAFSVSVYGGAFDDRYPSARATGLSNAYVAVANDVWAAYYNPAGLAQTDAYATGFAYQRLFNLSFFKNIFAAANVPLPGKYGTLAVSAEQFGVEYDGEWMSREYTAMVSHGFYLLNDMHSFLSVGYNLKYYYWELPESVDGLQLGSAGTFGVDVGLMASLYHRTYLGVYVYNINAPSFGAETQRELPQRIVVGASYRPITDLITTVSMDKTVGYDMMIEAGFEYSLIKYLTVRLGASTMPNRISAGLGIHYNGININYAFRNHPVLAETHQFGLVYVFQ